MNRVGGSINMLLSDGGLSTTIKGTGAEQYAKWFVNGQIKSTTSKDQKQNDSNDKQKPNNQQSIDRSV